MDVPAATLLLPYFEVLIQFVLAIASAFLGGVNQLWGDYFYVGL